MKLHAKSLIVQLKIRLKKLKIMKLILII